jgi:hypothetical protein
MKWWLANRPLPLFCCCAVHSQLNQAVSFVKWRWLPSCLMARDCPSKSVIYCDQSLFMKKFVPKNFLVAVAINKAGSVRITWHWGMFVQTLLQWKSSKCYIFWVCVCSLTYPTCSVDVPYYHLWPSWLYNIFPHYLMNGTIFCVLMFSRTFVRNFLRRFEGRVIKNVYWPSCKVSIILVRIDCLLPTNALNVNFI